MRRVGVTTAVGAGFLTGCYLTGWALGLQAHALEALYLRIAPPRVLNFDAVYPTAEIIDWKKVL